MSMINDDSVGIRVGDLPNADRLPEVNLPQLPKGSTQPLRVTIRPPGKTFADEDDPYDVVADAENAHALINEFSNLGAQAFERTDTRYDVETGDEVTDGLVKLDSGREVRIPAARKSAQQRFIQSPMPTAIGAAFDASVDARETIGKAVLKGVGKGAANTAKGVLEIITGPNASAVPDPLKLMYEGLVSIQESLIGDPSQIEGGVLELFETVAPDLTNWLAEPYDNQTLGNLIQSLSQFATPAVAAAAGIKAISSANAFVRSLGWGAIADYFAFTPMTPTATQSLIEAFDTEDPEQRLAVSKAAINILGKEQGQNILNRMKMLPEGALIGVTFEAVLQGIMRSPQGAQAAAELTRAASEIVRRKMADIGMAAEGRMAERAVTRSTTLNMGVDPGEIVDPLLSLLWRGPKEARPEAVTIKGTGGKKGDKVTPADIGDFYDQRFMEQHGRQGNPADPADFERAVDNAVKEVNYQLTQSDTGKGWYDGDIADTWEVAAQAIPALRVGTNTPAVINGEVVTPKDLRVMTTAIAAPLSFGQRPKGNFFNALKVVDYWIKNGRIPDTNPATGKGWTQRPIVSQSLRMMQSLIDQHGVKGFVDILTDTHTLQELRAFKRSTGVFNDTQAMSIPGKATDEVLGFMLLGRKGGAFAKNLNGIEDTTADLWFTRTFNRQFGRMRSPNLPADSQIKDQPITAERPAMYEWNKRIAEAIGESEQDTQAILWYFEQQLFYDMGLTSAKPSKFSDGARQYVDEFGGGEFGVGQRQAVQPVPEVRVAQRPGEVQPPDIDAPAVASETSPAPAGFFNDDLPLTGEQRSTLLRARENTFKTKPNKVVQDLISQGLWDESLRQDAVTFLSGMSDRRAAKQELVSRGIDLLAARSPGQASQRLERKRENIKREEALELEHKQVERILAEMEDVKNLPGREMWSKTFAKQVDQYAQSGSEHFAYDLRRAINRANLEAIPRHLKKLGWTVRHASKGGGGRKSSRYLVSPDKEFQVRLSEHEIMDTPQRDYRRQELGQYESWDDEIILRGNESPADLVDQILKLYEGAMADR